MTRAGCLVAWTAFYRGMPRDEAKSLAEAHSERLGRRMRLLGRLPAPLFHNFNKRTLQQALGMAYGVHKQLLAGLTFSAQGLKMRRAGGGVDRLRSGGLP